MIEIRQATRDDLPTLQKFQVQLALESEGISLDEAKLSAGLKALLNDEHKGVYYVALENQQVIACYLITFEWSDWRNGMVWWLQSVYVIESHRGKGVFRVMYEHVLAQINADPSVIGLRLYVDKSNARAMHVYRAMGMDGDHYTVFEWMNK
ncbi:GNAT family N-acetyltransferase [Pseudochryseolinea flava]|uniref:GNAT family N-acetyltransferase n=1 Tax=Pseudochryseolinea flava TaxID=2059302 RepID=A0A364Y804_9BACT|nr:GNAT family N-acetyltransferase [Pseudochryseolinea flava]RAW03117.1 GNAT family N-acetyltransferase [Pseudochryseolinea flava]